MPSPSEEARLLSGQPLNGGGDLTSLTLFDFSDRELLLIVAEQADKLDGFATTSEVADALGITGDHRMNSVGSRLAALRRFGAVEKDRNYSVSRWTVTPMGRLMASGKIKASAQKVLDGLGPESLLLVTRHLTTRARTAETPARLVQREFRRGF
jgi:hypothetical protein